MIRVDSREPDALKDAILQTADSLGIHADVALLASADIAFALPGTLVGIERKAVSDFVSSFIEGRLHRQLSIVRSQYDYPYLLIEGRMEWTVDPLKRDGKLYLAYRRGGGLKSYGLNHATVLNAQNGLLLTNPPTGLIRTDSLAETVLTVMEFYRMLSSGRHRDSTERAIMRGRAPMPGTEFRKDVAALAQVVGLQTAKLLLSQFGTIFRLITSADRDLLSVKGIGPVTLREIRTAFGVPGEVHEPQVEAEEEARSA